MAHIHQGASGCVYAHVRLVDRIDVTAWFRPNSDELRSSVRIWTDTGSAEVVDLDEVVIEKAPKAAALYGVELTEAAVAEAIAEGRREIAEHLLKKLHRVEPARAEVVS